MSSRTRIVLSIAVLFAFATAVSTLALRQVLLARVDTRIQAALAQEVRELQRFAGQVRTTDARTLFGGASARAGGWDSHRDRRSARAGTG